MKKNNILLGLISLLCVGTAAGCGGGGGAKYNIKTATSNQEDGTITGGGKFANGSRVTLKINPVEGCHEDAPVLHFIKEGEAEATGGPITTTLSADGEYYYYEFDVNNGSDGSNSNVGTYRASFTCKMNTIADIGSATTAKFDVNFKVIDDAGNEIKKADGKPLVEAQKGISYGGFATKITYVNEIEGKIQWYVANPDGSKSDALFDFSSSITSDLNLVGVVTESTPEAVILDAISNMKNSSILQIVDGNGKRDVVQDLNKGLDKMYYVMTDSFISENVYYQIKMVNNQNIYYKLPLGEGKSGFEVKDIKNVYDSLELAILQFGEGDVYDFSLLTEASGEAKKETLEISSDVGTYKDEGKEVTIGSYAYKIDGTNILMKTGDLDVGDYNESTKTITFAENAVEDVKNKTYKIEGNKVKSISQTIECKIYELKKDGKKYFDLYVNNGYIYKSIRYDNEGAPDISNNFDYSTATLVRWEMKTVYDMNVVKLSTDATAYEELSGKLNEINTSFEDVLKNVAAEAKTLGTLINDQDSLREILREYNYRICANSTCSAEVDPSLLLTVNTSSSVKDLYLDIKASYSTIASLLDELKNGNFTISTSTSVFGETITKSYSVANGVNVLDADTLAGISNTDMNVIIRNTFEKLSTLSDDYYNFKYNASSKKYEFYLNKDDSVPYLTINLNGEGKLESISYYDSNNANLQERNTYTSTFA